MVNMIEHELAQAVIEAANEADAAGRTDPEAEIQRLQGIVADVYRDHWSWLRSDDPMVTFVPQDDFTGEGYESEVWIHFHGEHEWRESEIVVNQYPYPTGDQAYAAAKRNADKLTEAWERLVKEHPDSDLGDLIARLGEVAVPMWKDFRT